MKHIFFNEHRISPKVLMITMAFWATMTCFGATQRPFVERYVDDLISRHIAATNSVPIPTTINMETVSRYNMGLYLANRTILNEIATIKAKLNDKNKAKLDSEIKRRGYWFGIRQMNDDGTFVKDNDTPAKYEERKITKKLRKRVALYN